MSCFGSNNRPDLYQNCCNLNNLCEFDGSIENIVTAPIYVQQVFDAVKFNMQGMKTFSDQAFSPAIPKGHRIKRVIDIRCKRFFNASNVDDPCNLALDLDTNISGACFLQDGKGKHIKTVGADGTYSERIMYADTSSCDEPCKGTPVFGTQNVAITGNLIIELDLLLCDSCNKDSVFTVCTNLNVASDDNPLVLTNFFEICMPSTTDTAFLPRFTQLSNSSCEARLATNNCGRDLNIDASGNITCNLIVAICITCEEKIVAPVQLCVLTSGYVNPPLQQNSVCSSFPGLFPENVVCGNDEQNCEDQDLDEDFCCQPHRPSPRRDRKSVV